MTARYDRAPSEALLALLADGGLLAPLRAKRSVAGLPLDLQFREGDQVHLYCGLTRLIAARRKPSGIDLTAAGTYANQTCAVGLFRRWRAHETGLEAALGRYLGGVRVDPRYVHKEGRVQAAWMARDAPWTTLDREAVLGRTSSAARAEAVDTPAVTAAHDAIAALAERSGWQRPPGRKAANELDQLGVDLRGRLVLVELKHARSLEVPTAPLQALRYAWEWHDALPEVRPALEKLLDARKRAGLSPAGTPALTGEIRSVVAWADGDPSPEVSRRLRAVKAIVDGKLPPGVGSVEVWALPDGRPERVA